MKLKKKEAVELLQNLQKCDDLSGEKLVFALSKNKIKLKRALEEFFETREEINNKYSEKDKSGKVVVAENGGIKITDTEAYNKSIKELVNEEIDVELHEIDPASIEHVKDKISVKQMDALVYFIKEVKEEVKKQFFI